MFGTFANANVKRGCGESRDRGGVYAEVGFSAYGSPLENFLFDPIPRFEKDRWGLSPRSPLLIQGSGGIWHVYDWIGKSGYPNTSDCLEEIRRFGLSRKLELTAEQYNKLTITSRIILVVPNAWINPALLAMTYEHPEWSPGNMGRVGYKWSRCPAGNHDLKETTATCAGWLWRQAIWNVKKYPDPELDADGFCRVEMPAFNYSARRAPDGFLDASPDLFDAGMVAAFRIGRLAVVADPVGNTHLEKMDRLKDCEIRVDLTEE